MNRAASEPRDALRFQRDDATLSRHTIEGVVLLAASATKPLLIEGSAASLWELLVTPMTVAEVVRSLAATYDIDGDAVFDEIDRTMSTLTDAGVLCRR